MDFREQVVGKLPAVEQYLVGWAEKQKVDKRLPASFDACAELAAMVADGVIAAVKRQDGTTVYRRRPEDLLGEGGYTPAPVLPDDDEDGQDEEESRPSDTGSGLPLGARVMSSAEASVVVGCQTGSLIRYAKRGLIRYERTGGGGARAYVYLAEDVERLAEDRKKLLADYQSRAAKRVATVATERKLRDVLLSLGTAARFMAPITMDQWRRAVVALRSSHDEAEENAP